jgi:hypothetical protein
MKNASIQLTRSVSQISTNSSASLSDDLLNTNRMTIESMIESTEVAICLMKFLDVFLDSSLLFLFNIFMQKATKYLQICQGSVIATICEIETGVDWYFRSCTQCASLATVDNGVLRCRKCKTCKGAVPR